MVHIDLRSRSDLYLTITAELVTLVPGSMVIEVRRSTSTLYMHVLGVRDDSDVERARAHALAVEERVVRRSRLDRAGGVPADPVGRSRRVAVMTVVLWVCGAAFGSAAALAVWRMNPGRGCSTG